MEFSDDQFNAARSFAYTMIVVDDEPVVEAPTAKPLEVVKTPGRKDVAAAKKKVDKPAAQRSHELKTKDLIKSALESGLVCSVVNPSGDEENVAQSVAKASIRADIVSLDWHMNQGDDGDLASEIIKEILVKDKAIGGRLRLIAIYTGNKDYTKILSQITETINAAADANDQVTNHGNFLTNSTGLRIIWREKAMGNDKLPKAISETQLPQELLKEFSKLSNGLLSNVALATISSMRDTTHHVLSKFSSELDGPFFHHRALLENPIDSMDYAVSIVMSALKSEVNKSQITEEFTTIDAVKRRIETIANGSDNFTLRYVKEGNEKQFHFCLNEILAIIENENDTWPPEVLSAAKARKENASNSKPTNASYKNDFSTVFSETKDAAKQSMMHFSFLTNSSSSELSKVHRKVSPKLGLGSVLHSEGTGYLLCLQATCDAVRGDGLFFFIPLSVTEGSPDIVVPHQDGDGKPAYIGLTVPGKCYTKSVSLNFGVIDKAIGHIPIGYDEKRNFFKVSDVGKTEYRWLANLKYKRALRIAQNVSQQMSRIGFDEFEPFKR